VGSFSALPLCKRCCHAEAVPSVLHTTRLTKGFLTSRGQSLAFFCVNRARNGNNRTAEASVAHQLETAALPLICQYLFALLEWMPLY
jgi:hypothetical protein